MAQQFTAKTTAHLVTALTLARGLQRWLDGLLLLWIMHADCILVALRLSQQMIRFNTTLVFDAFLQL
jgi:hypothetical protein